MLHEERKNHRIDSIAALPVAPFLLLEGLGKHKRRLLGPCGILAIAALKEFEEKTLFETGRLAANAVVKFGLGDDERIANIRRCRQNRLHALSHEVVGESEPK